MDSKTLNCWRYGLMTIMAVEGGVMAYAAWSLQRFKPILNGNPLWLSLAGNPFALASVWVLTVASLVAFLRPRGSWHWGIPALAGMKALFEVFATIYSAHHQDFFQTGAVLFGFLLGEIYARCLGIRSEEGDQSRLAARRLGAIAGIAMFAASYVAAGTSKLIYGGSDWIDSPTIRLMVLAHTEIGTGSWKDSLGAWIGASPYLCSLLQIGTVVIQVGAFALVLGPRWRTFWATLIVLFHIGIYLSSNILFLQPLLFAAVIAIPWSGLGRSASVRTDTDQAIPSTVGTDREARRQWVMIAVAAVLVLWLTSSTVVYAGHWDWLRLQWESMSTRH